MSAEDAARKLQEKFGHGSPPTREDAKGYLGEALAKVRPAASARPKRWRSSICACPKRSNTACAFSRRAIVVKCPISSSRRSNSTKRGMARRRCSNQHAKARRVHALAVPHCRGRRDGRHALDIHAAPMRRLAMIGCISERGWTANKRVNRKRPARAGLLRCLLTNHVRLSRRRLSRTSRTWCDEACGSAMYGPAVCCKGKPSQRGTFGLAPMYQTYLWSVWNAPGHHGYERAFD